MKQRLRMVDTLKGICILLVIISHCKYIGFEREQYYFQFWVDMAVPTFMILSGYILSFSFDMKSLQSVKQLYDAKLLIKRLLRLVIPFLVIFAIEALKCGYFSSIVFTIKSFITGGVGAGGYYFACVIQLVFLFPVIYLLVRNKPERGLLICFIANVVFEIINRVVGLEPAIFRILVFRYTFAVACGSFLYFNKKKIGNQILLTSFLFGIIAMILIRYVRIRLPFISVYWSTTCYLCVFYLFPIMYFL